MNLAGFDWLAQEEFGVKSHLPWYLLCTQPLTFSDVSSGSCNLTFIGRSMEVRKTFAEKEPRLREVERSAHGHTAGSWQS